MVVKQKKSETVSLLKFQVHMLAATVTKTHEEDILHVLEGCEGEYIQQKTMQVFLNNSGFLASVTVPHPAKVDSRLVYLNVCCLVVVVQEPKWPPSPQLRRCQ